MRREGFEFEVGRPQVVTITEGGIEKEPVEEQTFLEDFFEKYATVIDYLKIKAGYGEIGNGNAAPSVNQILFQNGATYPFGSPEIIYPGSFVPYAVDPDLTWETTKEFGGGIEFRMLKQ